MVQNYLSISGTVQGVQGNDARAPYAYWDRYSYRPVTSGEISSLTDGNVNLPALSLAAGEYACLEISFDPPVYASQFKCYLTDPVGPHGVALSFPHTTENPSSHFIDLSISGNVVRENVQGNIFYYDSLGSDSGYTEGPAVNMVVGEYAQLISALYTTTVSSSPNVTRTGYENKILKQIIHPDSVSDGVFSQVKIQAGDSPVYLDSVSIAPLITTTQDFHFDHDTQDHSVKDELCWWYSDNGSWGHFEGRVIPLDAGTAITGTWSQEVSWSGVGKHHDHTGLANCSVRQTIPIYELGYLGDGLRVTLSGSPTHDLSLRYMSYLPSNSNEVKLIFGSNSSVYREDIKHGIERWKNDGLVGNTEAAHSSRRRGHFEGYAIDVNDGSQADPFTANVIGIPATSHGLKAGDYIRVYGTEFYDGYYFVLSFSTAHIVYIWGIYDSEIFTSNAKIRRIITLGPHIDDYGVKADCRAIVPYVQLHMTTGETTYIVDYTDRGLLHGSVELGPDEIATGEVMSAYDVVVDGEGWLSNTPGPAVTPDSKQSIPNTRLRPQDMKWSAREAYDDSFASPNLGYHAGGYSRIAAELWKGKFDFISESRNPAYEGDQTGWTGISSLFDQYMSQPIWTTTSLADCAWITMCYRGPIPAKFIIDMGEPRLLSKYKYWIQTVICPFGRFDDVNLVVGWPRSWKVEASDHGDNSLEWDILQQVIDYKLVDYTNVSAPPDERLAFTCAESLWEQYKNLRPYRYYRFHVYESWTCTERPGRYECCHIDEIDFVEHRCTAGIFPTVIESTLYMDVVKRITPDELLYSDSKIFYAISFDQGSTFEIYLPNIEQWRTIARDNNGQWEYFDGMLWHPTDPTKPLENTLRFVLWYAFSVKENRMNAIQLQNIPEVAYKTRLPHGGYLRFAVALISSSKTEAVLKGITINGTIFNPNGSENPTEITFNGGQSGCDIAAGEKVTSDWINDDVVTDRDALFVMDFATTASAVPYFNYTAGYKYFYRAGTTSYDLQAVTTNTYTMATGVVLIQSVDIRQSDTITLPATAHGLPEGSYIRVSGTYPHYDGYHYVARSHLNSVEIPSKHWFQDSPVLGGSNVQRRYSIGPGNLQPHTQVGSIIQFSGTGGYYTDITHETSTYPHYWVSSNTLFPGNEAHNLFDSDTAVEFHSGQPMSYGSVIIGLHLQTAQLYNKYRFRASYNESFWRSEYPYAVSVAGSNLSSPSLIVDSDWVILASGITSLPIGAGRASSWNVCTSSGSYLHYRFKIDSNRGSWYDAVRIAKLSLANDIEEFSNAYIIVDVAPGFQPAYLLDGSATSDWVSVTTNTAPCLGLDFRHKPRVVSRLRFKTATGDLLNSAGSQVYPWDLKFPKLLEFGGSNLTTPSLGNDSHWTTLKSFNYGSAPGAENIWYSWLDVISGTETYDPYRHFRIKFLSNMGGQIAASGISIRVAELDFDYNDILQNVNYITKDTVLPIKLLDLPAMHTIVGGEVTTTEGFAGGYAEQVGYVATATVNTSFWTMVDMHWQLENSRAISRVGIYSDITTVIDIKLCKLRSAGHFDLSEIQSLSHPGTGFVWFTLTYPHLIPDTGDYYLGYYQPNYPVKMVDNTGTGAVAYEYGSYTGTNISLPWSNTMRPCWAVRYASCFTVGIDTTDDVMPRFSPALAERVWGIEQVVGPFTEPKSLYLYRDCVMSSGDLTGVMRVQINYADQNADSYGVRPYTIEDNGYYLSYDRTAQTLTESSPTTDFYSYRPTNSSVQAVLRFGAPVKVLAFRYKPKVGGYGWEQLFPTGIDLMVSSVWAEPSETSNWTSLYEDEAYYSGGDYWGPWAYIDDVSQSYRYFLFSWYHPDTAVEISVAALELLIEYNEQVWVVVPELYNTIEQIVNEGMGDAEIKLWAEAGLSRNISDIYNTFSSYQQTELAPGTFFYRGENTPWFSNPHPVLVTTDVPLGLCAPEVGGLNLIAWHVLDEVEGDFLDSSGHNITATRVGNITTASGRKGLACAHREDDGNILCTLPATLEEYTVSFWFTPKYDVTIGYQKQFDIMGGWASYGAIPGVWHISVAKHMLYEFDPYPAVQQHDVYHRAYGIADYGNMVFGNYGGRIDTSRNYWKAGRWYHVVFSFHAGGTAANPYKCWINGVRDTEARWSGYDNGQSIYPPPDTIMVDPNDIHYDTHSKNNCMYFGLPLAGGLGLSEPFSLQNIMHFNKILSDAEVFKIFRLQQPLSNTWDGIYFADTEFIESLGQITINLGEPKCVTKYGLMVPSGITSRVKWRFLASGTGDPVVLHEAYEPWGSIPTYYNLLNFRPYQYYIIDLIDSQYKEDYLLLNGLRLVDVPLIPTVSGTYATVTSGVQNAGRVILELTTSGLAPAGSMVTLETSGNGPLYTRHIFTALPIYDYPVVSGIRTVQTEWHEGSPSVITIDTSLTSQQVAESDWTRYNLSQSEYHLITFDFAGTQGNPSYSDEGLGFLLNAVYTSSGSYLVAEVIARSQDITSLPVDNTVGLQMGDTVCVQGAGPYTGRWTVVGAGSNLVISAPYEPYTMMGGTYRRAIVSDINAGAEVVMTSGNYCVTQVRGAMITLSGDPVSQLITAVYDSSVTPSGVIPTHVYPSDEIDGLGTHIYTTSISGSMDFAYIDMGIPTFCNGYRWRGITYPVQWEVYGTNTLPNWELLDTVSGSGSGWATHTLPSPQDYRYYVFRFWEEVALNELQLLRSDLVASEPESIGSITVSGYWAYTALGRLSRVGVRSYEPTGTVVFHGVTFDSGNTFKVWVQGEWLAVVRFYGAVWQYYDNGWLDALNNTVYFAFRQAVEEAGHWFDTTQLGAVSEMEWHTTGAIETTSGSLGFVYYLASDGVFSPHLHGYELFYQTLGSGISNLIPDGYSFAYPEHTAGTPCISYRFTPNTPDEVIYDRKLLESLRVYLANTSLNEVSIVDCRAAGEIDYAGGLLLSEGESVAVTFSPITDRIYYGEKRLYFDPRLGPPSGSFIGWGTTDRYLYNYLWSNEPIEPQSMLITNSGSCSADNPIRIYDTTVLPLTYSGEWNVSDTFNLIESSHTTNSNTNILGYPIQQLTTPHLEALIDMTVDPIPIFAGYGVSLISDLGTFGGKVQGINMYLDSASGVEVRFMTQASGYVGWQSYVPSVSGGLFYTVFDIPLNVQQLEVGVLNTATSGSVDYNDIRWLRALQLVNCGSGIDFGPTGSGENTLSLPTYYTDYNKIQIFNNNQSATYANARVLPRYSGDYDLDRTIRVSEDTLVWSDLNCGVNLPEDYAWETGHFDGTRVVDNKIVLEETAVSGTWRSPVIEVLDPSSTAAYIYVNNTSYELSYVNEDYISIKNTVKVRTYFEKPKQLFMVTGVNTDNEFALQAPWKIVLFRSDGNVVSDMNYSALDAYDAPPPPRRYWDVSAPCLWQFYGALDARGLAGISLGMQFAGNAGTVDGDIYKFYRGFPSTGGPYSAGTWGSVTQSINIFNSNWVFSPIFNKSLQVVDRSEGGTTKKSWHMVDVVFRPEPFYELYEEHYYSNKVFHARSLYAFTGTASTPESGTEIDYLYSFEGTIADLQGDGIRCAACLDNVVGGEYYWFHYGCNYSTVYYKTLLVNGSTVEQEFDNIRHVFNYIVEAGTGEGVRGFWGITETAVYWYEFTGGNLVEHFGITGFKRLHHGCTDSNNNLWFVDVATEQVIRVNFQTQSVDYSRTVNGAASVACEPYDSSAYVYVIRSREFPTQDCIKIVHVGDYDCLEPEVVCVVPGAAMIDNFNINLTIRSTFPAGSYDILPEDPLWSESVGSLPWRTYSAGSPALPHGMYKQFKLTLRRGSLTADSPEVEYIRIPVPALINKIPWRASRDIFVDTIPRAQNYDLIAGEHDLDLLIWWVRE